MKSAILALLVASVTALSAATAHAQAVSPTTFTYQGRLTNAGTPLNGTTDIQFTLYSALTGGSPVGSTITLTGVPVTDGLLNASVDFGRAALNSGARYVEVAVKPAGFGAYSTLTPRQTLTSAPFAAMTDGISRPDATTVALLGQVSSSEVADITCTNMLNAYLTTSDAWQSFTPVNSGNLTGLGVDFLGGGTQGGTLEIRAGEGTGGALVYTQPVSFTIGSPTRINITGTCPLVAGQRYTWRITAFNNLFPVFNSDVYAGGRSYYTTANTDLYFITYLIPNPQSVPALTATAAEVQIPGVLRVNGAPSTGMGLSVRGPEWIRLSSTASHDWHMNNSGGGLNFVESNVADYRLFLAFGGNVGVGTGTPVAKLDVAGNIRCTTLTQTSSAVYKTEITPLPHALDTLKRLQGVAYLWNEQAPEDRRGKHDIGFIAEQVNTVVPEIVAKDAEGHALGIDYGRITAIAVEAVKEQDARIATLEAQLASIRESLATQAAKK